MANRRVHQLLLNHTPNVEWLQMIIISFISYNISDKWVRVYLIETKKNHCSSNKSIEPEYILCLTEYICGKIVDLREKKVTFWRLVLTRWLSYAPRSPIEFM